MADAPRLADDVAVGRRVLETEAEGLRLLSDSLDARFAEAVETLAAAKGRIICAGIGKSGHIARKMAATFASTGAPAQFVHSNEASHGDLGMISRDDVVVMLSKSGASAELADVIAYTRRFSVPLIAITAGTQSALGKAADILLQLPDAPEACGQTKAPTTSTTMTMALGDALAVALIERRGFKADDFKVYHPGGKLGAMLKRARDVMQTGDALPLVETGASLAEALSEISAKGLGCVGIVKNERLVGMVTDGDLRRLLATGRSAETVNDAMTADPFTANEDDLAASVLATLNTRKFTQVFVTDDAVRPVGVIHLHDLLKAGLA